MSLRVVNALKNKTTPILNIHDGLVSFPRFKLYVYFIHYSVALSSYTRP